MSHDSRTETHSPRLAPLRLPQLADTPASELRRRTVFDGERLRAAASPGHDLSGYTFTETELLGWTVRESSLQGSRFALSRLERLDAPVFAARRSHWSEIEISSSRIGSAEWSDSDLSRVEVAQSKLGWLNLRGSRLTDVRFTDCQIEELDLSGAAVTRVAFRNTSVNRLILTKATIRHLDLRGAELRTIQDLGALRGATISTFQLDELAGLLAAHLGIIVRTA